MKRPLVLLNQTMGEAALQGPAIQFGCRPIRAQHFRLSFAAICRSDLLRGVAGWLMAWGPGIVT